LHEEKITVYCSPEELLDSSEPGCIFALKHGLAVESRTNRT